MLTTLLTLTLLAPTTRPAVGDAAGDAAGHAADRLMADVTTLATEYADRDMTHPEVYAAAADWLEGRMADAGYEVTRRAFEVHGQQVVNLAAELPGTDRGLPVLVVGAHYDSVPNSPGADDNASGVAAVLELMARLRDAGPERGVRFALWANEEPPHWQTPTMGSAVDAAAAGEGEVFGVLALDMLGYFSDEPGSQTVPPGMEGAVPTTADFVAVGGPPVSRELIGRVVDAWGDAEPRLIPAVIPAGGPLSGMSDHWAFTRRGIPGVIVTDTSFLSSPHYHRATDTPDTLDTTRLAATVDRLEAVIRELVGG